MLFTKHWELIKHLTLREIKARYKQSFLGFFWIILNPFFQMLILSFVFSKILRVHNLGVPYPVYLYAGLLPWVFFATSLSSAMGILVDNAQLIKKIYFPREILVLSTLLAKAFDFGLSLLIFAVLLLWFHIPFTGYMFLFMPIFVLQFIFTFSVALVLSSLNLLYRDIQYLFNLIINLLFYVTPVIYAVEFFPAQYRWVFKFNPMSIFINAYRQVLLTDQFPNWSSLGIGALLTILLFIIAYRLFKKLERIFADVV